jgi:CubicO group peptidase (beta-lactamase class C family)
VIRTFDAARAIVEAGVRDQAYPAACIDTGCAAGSRWQEAFGALTYADDAPACRLETLFDVASLTKVIAAVPLTVRQVVDGAIAFDTPLSAWLPDWRHPDREHVTVRHVLAHASGLPAHADIWRRGRGRRHFEREIAAVPLDAPPGTRAVYSDLGFLSLGFLLTDVGGMPLAAQFGRLEGAAGDDLLYCPSRDRASSTAPTEVTRERGLVRGTVHDENAAALDGEALHAGLFGTAGAIGAFARTVLRTFREETSLGTPELMRLVASPSAVPGSSRALGWDLMRPTSSCGTRLAPSAIGHTGFTGTSLWIDWERDLYVVFLTNRIHPTRANDKHLAIRPRLHDAIADATF